MRPAARVIDDPNHAKIGTIVKHLPDISSSSIIPYPRAPSSSQAHVRSSTSGVPLGGLLITGAHHQDLSMYGVDHDRNSCSNTARAQSQNTSGAHHHDHLLTDRDKTSSTYPSKRTMKGSLLQGEPSPPFLPLPKDTMAGTQPWESQDPPKKTVHIFQPAFSSMSTQASPLPISFISSIPNLSTPYHLPPSP